MRGQRSRMWTAVLSALIGWAGTVSAMPDAVTAPVPASAGPQARFGLPLELPQGLSALLAPATEAPSQGDGHPLLPRNTRDAIACRWVSDPLSASPPIVGSAGLLGLTANPATAPPLS